MDRNTDDEATSRCRAPSFRLIGGGKLLKTTRARVHQDIFPDDPEPDFSANPDFWFKAVGFKEVADFLGVSPRTIKAWRYNENREAKESADV